MSMNLYIEFEGVEQEVYQTPTHITNMCLMTHAGFDWSVTGNNAKRAVRCYMQWVASLKNGSYSSREEHYELTKPINDHIEVIKQGLVSAKKIRAYTL